ncbi:MAG: PQQ-binding-like beta-propeller repeat protein [Halobacteriota archaeon]
MALGRRGFLKAAAGVTSAVGLTALAGCASSCPDSDPPDPAEQVSIDAEPVGPFSDPPEGRWPAVRGDSANTGFSTGPLPSAHLELRWRADLDIPTEDGVGVVASAPVVGDEQVYVADSTRVHARSLRTGEPRWESEPFPVTEIPSYSHRAKTIAPRLGPDGRVFVGTEDGLVVLDAADGTVRWRDDAMQAVAPPAVTEAGVYVQGAQSVRALELDGTPRWDRAVEADGEQYQPAATSRAVLSRLADGIEARDPETGERLWHRSIRPESAPVLDGGTCIVGTTDGLVGLAARSGTEQFRYTRGDYLALQSPVVTPETIYAVEQPPEAGAAAFALSRSADGLKPRWCSAIGDGAMAAATSEHALTSTSVGTGPEAGRGIVAFTADSGAVPWAVVGGGRSDTWTNPPAILDGVLIVSTRGGRIVAVSGAET